MTIGTAMTRRTLIGVGGAAGFALLAPGAQAMARQETPEVDPLRELVIDLAGDPVSIDPAFAYSARDWSIVHSIYDGLIAIAEDGTIQPLAAETFDVIDDLTFEAKLREGLTFHDGAPVTVDAVIRGIEH